MAHHQRLSTKGALRLRVGHHPYPDHCLAAEDVPGVLFANRRIRTDAPTLLDLAPTILAQFGVSQPLAMIGRNVLDGTPTA